MYKYTYIYSLVNRILPILCFIAMFRDTSKIIDLVRSETPKTCCAPPIGQPRMKGYCFTSSGSNCGVGNTVSTERSYLDMRKGLTEPSTTHVSLAILIFQKYMAKSVFTVAQTTQKGCIKNQGYFFFVIHDF